MLWHKLVIETKEGSMATNSAVCLLERFQVLYRKAAAPQEAEIYHLQTHGARHVYLFSPRASEIAKDIFPLYKEVTALDQSPNTEGFVRLKL